ncbi:hypothetical protein RRG08_034140 [Elysia crispata]|uniref:Uncharacterized protein n=1 Tax=Elysia crispata TaxID=231223 RepID=A0AAE0ZKH3_9GAST|nr:hypothetical protein RRG08_034140 [Elysia crispata]
MARRRLWWDCQCVVIGAAWRDADCGVTVNVLLSGRHGAMQTVVGLSMYCYRGGMARCRLWWDCQCVVIGAAWRDADCGVAVNVLLSRGGMARCRLWCDCQCVVIGAAWRDADCGVTVNVLLSGRHGAMQTVV